MHRVIQKVKISSCLQFLKLEGCLTYPCHADQHEKEQINKHNYYFNSFVEKKKGEVYIVTQSILCIVYTHTSAMSSTHPGPSVCN